MCTVGSKRQQHQNLDAEVAEQDRNLIVGPTQPDTPGPPPGYLPGAADRAVGPTEPSPTAPRPGGHAGPVYLDTTEPSAPTELDPTAPPQPRTCLPDTPPPAYETLGFEDKQH